MDKQSPIYLDSASTTPVDQRVLDKMLPYFTDIFGNASSNHIYGRKAKQAIDEARDAVANLIGAESNEIYFTSGSTEGINWALKGFIEGNPEKGNHIITSKTEHKAVLNTCKYLETKGYDVTYLEVNQNGLISLEDLKKSIKATTAMIAIMYVNNEVGVIQNIPEIGAIANENGICFFCDATQAVGKIPVNVEVDKIDMLCLSGHKLRGPKGVGALYIRNELNILPLIHGGGQEAGMRSGTYNTPLIVGLGEACRLAKADYVKNLSEWIKNKEFWKHKFEIEGHGTSYFEHIPTAPHILSIKLSDSDGDDFLMIQSNRFIASTGSACVSSLQERSHVIKAIVGEFDSKKFIRISF